MEEGRPHPLEAQSPRRPPPLPPQRGRCWRRCTTFSCSAVWRPNVCACAAPPHPPLSAVVGDTQIPPPLRGKGENTPTQESALPAGRTDPRPRGKGKFTNICRIFQGGLPNFYACFPLPSPPPLARGTLPHTTLQNAQTFSPIIEFFLPIFSHTQICNNEIHIHIPPQVRFPRIHLMVQWERTRRRIPSAESVPPPPRTGPIRAPIPHPPPRGTLLHDGRVLPPPGGAQHHRPGCAPTAPPPGVAPGYITLMVPDGGKCEHTVFLSIQQFCFCSVPPMAPRSNTWAHALVTMGGRDKCESWEGPPVPPPTSQTWWRSCTSPGCPSASAPPAAASSPASSA